jgi:hypothetical protein
MLLNVFDKITGFYSRKWLIGRRLIIDFSTSRERRVSVIELPVATFHIELRKVDGAHELLMSANGSQQVLASFDDEFEAEQAMKRMKVGILRPFKKAVLACLGVLIIFFAFDVATAPRGGRSVQVNGATTRNSQNPGGLTQDQVSQLLRERGSGKAQSSISGPAGIPSNPAQGPASSDMPAPATDTSVGSPEAQAAIKLLKGR